MNFSQLFEKKKNNQPLSKEEIAFIVENFRKGSISATRLTNFMSIINENNFSYEETYFLAEALANTGTRYSPAKENDIVFDKHSAGLISDPTTLIFMSVLASLDVKAVKALSANFGTFRNSLERLKAIKGFSVKSDEESFKKILKKNNMAVIEDMGQIAPVDKVLYNLRLENKILSIPLIASSILAKKIALGANYYVFDVKTGEGSMGNSEQFSLKLATFLVESAKVGNKGAVSVVTYLDQPLSNNLGNRSEIEETVDVLKNMSFVHSDNLYDVSRELVVVALMLCKKANTRSDATALFEDAIKSGKAYQKFCDFVKAYGGDISTIQNPLTVIDGVGTTYITSQESGYINDVVLSNIKKAYDILKLKNNSKPDSNANIELLAREGDKILYNDKLARIIYSMDNKNIYKARQELLEAFVTHKNRPQKHKVLYKIIV